MGKASASTDQAAPATADEVAILLREEFPSFSNGDAMSIARTITERYSLTRPERGSGDPRSSAGSDLVAREAAAKAIRSALTEEWTDADNCRRWEEDVLLTGCRKVGAGSGYSNPEQAAQKLALMAADAVLALNEPHGARLTGAVDTTPLKDRWPLGCRSPNSCSRNGRCMYAGCKHDGKDIGALALAMSRPERGSGDPRSSAENESEKNK